MRSGSRCSPGRNRGNGRNGSTSGIGNDLALKTLSQPPRPLLGLNGFISLLVRGCKRLIFIFVVRKAERVVRYRKMRCLPITLGTLALLAFVTLPTALGHWTSASKGFSPWNKPPPPKPFNEKRALRAC